MLKSQGGSKFNEKHGSILLDNLHRFLGPRRQRKVTGLIISDESLGVGRINKRTLRAAIHGLVRANLSKAETEKLRRHISGWLAYMNAVDRKGLEQLKLYAKRLALAHGTQKAIKGLWAK